MSERGISQLKEMLDDRSRKDAERRAEQEASAQVEAFREFPQTRKNIIWPLMEAQRKVLETAGYSVEIAEGDGAGDTVLFWKTYPHIEMFVSRLSAEDKESGMEGRRIRLIAFAANSDQKVISVYDGDSGYVKGTIPLEEATTDTSFEREILTRLKGLLT